MQSMTKYERDRCRLILEEAGTNQDEETAEAAADPLKRDLDENGDWTNSGLNFGEEPLPEKYLIHGDSFKSRLICENSDMKTKTTPRRHVIFC